MISRAVALVLLLQVPSAFGVPCLTSNAQFSDYANISSLAHVIGNRDDRGELPAKAKDLGLTKEEVKQLRTSLGAVKSLEALRWFWIFRAI